MFLKAVQVVHLGAWKAKVSRPGFIMANLVPGRYDGCHKDDSSLENIPEIPLEAGLA
jgi:hypothetical protein